jgi:hypothetical protein
VLGVETYRMEDGMRRWPATRGVGLSKLHCTHEYSTHIRKSEIMYIISAVSVRMPASFTPEPI